MNVEEVNDSFVEEEVLEVLELPVVTFELEYDATEETVPKSHDFLGFISAM